MAKDLLYPLRRLHGMMIKEKLRRKEKAHYTRICSEKMKMNPEVAYLVLTPEHTNLGDHAIASEETKILQQLGIDYIEITGKQLESMQRKRILNVMNGTPILINGGGNMGTLWFEVEQLMRDVVKANPKSSIFILPNTIFFEDSDYGKEAFAYSQKVYNSHKRLTLYAREETSYSIMKSAYKNVKLVPDMVLLRSEYTHESLRNGCLLCLRNDREKTISAEASAKLNEQVRQLFENRVEVTDTHADRNVPVDQREMVLTRKLDEFRRAELVITDRLHGMIFCAITGTPCIVINSKSPKIRGCYEWIKHLDYIRFANNPEDIITEYRAIPEGPHYYDNSHLIHYYQSLADDIQNIWR